MKGIGRHCNYVNPPIHELIDLHGICNAGPFASSWVHLQKMWAVHQQCDLLPGYYHKLCRSATIAWCQLVIRVSVTAHLEYADCHHIIALEVDKEKLGVRPRQTKPKVTLNTVEKMSWNCCIKNAGTWQVPEQSCDLSFGKHRRFSRADNLTPIYN